MFSDHQLIDEAANLSRASQDRLLVSVPRLPATLYQAPKSLIPLGEYKSFSFSCFSLRPQ